MTLDLLIRDYGYAAVTLGTFLEGETILVLGGLAAHLGYLDLPAVMAAGFAGSFTGDQLWFFVGRRHGPGILARRRTWQPRAERVFRILERHQTLLILGFRFLYGLRTVTPFALGMSRVTVLRYVPLNAAGAAAWTVVVAGAGFLFGQAAEALLGELKRYEHWLLGGVALAGAALWGVSLLRARRAARARPAGPPPAPGPGPASVPPPGPPPP